MTRNDLVASNSRDAIGRSSEGSTVGSLWCVEGCRECINGATPWARVRLLDGGESQRLQSLHVGFGDARGECDLRHEVEDASKARDWCPGANGEALPARLRSDRCAEQLARFNEPVGVVVLCPLGEEARQQRRESGLFWALTCRTAAEEHLNRGDRPRRHWEQDHAHSCTRLALNGAWEAPRARRTRPRSHGAVAHD